MSALLAAALAILLYVLAFPPADLGLLGFVALWPWCFLARRFAGWRLALVGYATGAVILTAGCFWIRHTHPANVVLMLIPESLVFALFALWLRLLLVHGRLPATLALPVVFVAVEWGRSHFPLDGYPWLVLGTTQHRWLELVQVSDLSSVHGVSFLLALGAGAAADSWHIFRRSQQGEVRGRLRGGLPLAGFALVLIAAHVYGAMRLGDPADLAPGPRVLGIQPNIPQQLKAAAEQDVLQTHLDLSERALRARASEGVDLLVWSETMLWGWSETIQLPLPGGGDPSDVWGWDRSTGRPVTAGMAAQVETQLLERVLRPRLLEPFGCWLLAGALTRRGDVKRGDLEQLNSAVLYDPEGIRRGLYHKTILVPGGEYLPWLPQLPEGLQSWLRGVVKAMAGFVPEIGAGSGPVVFEVGHGDDPTRAGVTICYEIAYPEYGREVVREGSDLLLNLSNEAWFPDSAEFAQYTAMAAFRAAEVKRSLVRVANSGTSAIVDPWGRVRALEQDGRRDGFGGWIYGRPARSEEITLFVAWGDFWSRGCCAVALILGIVALVRARRSAAPRPVTVPTREG